MTVHIKFEELNHLDGTVTVCEKKTDGTQDGVDHTEPLCIVRGTEIVTTDARKQIKLVNDMIIDIPDLETHSRFGISPFTINLTHKDAPLRRQMILDKALRH